MLERQAGSGVGESLVPRPSVIIGHVLADMRRLIADGFKPGEPIPSTRQWTGMYNVSNTTIHRALQVLASEGLVVFRKRNTCVRTPENKSDSEPRKGKRPRTPVRIGIVMSISKKGWDASHLKECLRRHMNPEKFTVVECCNSRATRPSYLASLNRVDIERVPWNTFDVGLLVHILYPSCLEHPHLRAQRLLSVDDDYRCYGIDSVCFDNHASGGSLARHLLDLGHRRFAVAEETGPDHFPLDPAWIERRHGFEAEVARNGCRMELHWRVLVLRNGLLVKPAQKTLSAWLAEPPSRRPTALFLPDLNHNFLTPWFEACIALNVRIPRDLSIAGFASESPYLPDGHKITCSTGSEGGLLQRALEAAIDLANERAPKERPSRLFTVPRGFEAGETTMRATS